MIQEQEDLTPMVRESRTSSPPPQFFDSPIDFNDFDFPLSSVPLTDDDDLARAGVVLVADLVGGRRRPELLHRPRPRRHVHQNVVALCRRMYERTDSLQNISNLDLLI